MILVDCNLTFFLTLRYVFIICASNLILPLSKTIHTSWRPSRAISESFSLHFPRGNNGLLNCDTTDQGFRVNVIFSEVIGLNI